MIEYLSHYRYTVCWVSYVVYAACVIRLVEAAR